MNIEQKPNNNTSPAIAMQCYAQVFLGDCLELYKNIEPKSIDLILTDLPYGTTACKWDTIIPFDKLWEMVNYLLKPNGAFITTASQPFTSALVMSNVKWFKYSLVWDKKLTTGHLNCKKMQLRRHEDIVIFCNGKTTYNPQKVLRDKIRIDKNSNKEVHGDGIGTYGKFRLTDKYLTHREPTSIIEISNANKTNIFHPTQKPIALFEYLLKTYSNECMTIFDPCMGSGTTGIACKNLNRNFIGIEKDENYFKIAEQRINAQTQSLF
jgi:site-specific DNA-methyltransferase (adenine-specific)